MALTTSRAFHRVNGHAPAREEQAQPPAAPTADELMPSPPWLTAMRTALADSLNAQTLTAVIAKQVEKAKDGDLRAANFIMKQAHELMKSGPQQVTITQNNNYYTDRPDTPAAAPPGDSVKLGKMAARAQAGLPLTSPNDAGYGRVMSDEEEKELRRREAEAEENN